MMTPQHDFKVGDRITVFDPFTVVAPFMWPTEYHVVGIEEDYFKVITTGSAPKYERIPKAYKHMNLNKPQTISI